MRGVGAMPMRRIGEHLNDPARANVAMLAGGHAHQFRLQRSQPDQAFADGGEVTMRNCVGTLAGRIRCGVGKAQQFADVLHCEAQLTPMPDEAQSIEMVLPIDAMPTLAPRRHGQQPLSLIEADGRRLYARGARKIAYGESGVHGASIGRIEACAGARDRVAGGSGHLRKAIEILDKVNSRMNKL